MDVQQSLADWIPKVQGQYINMDNAYGAQCWDLAAHWSTTLGLPVINTGGPGRWPGWAGNMVDGFPQTGAIAAAYQLIAPGAAGKAGDIVVWGDSYYYYPSTHVAVLMRDNGAQLLCVSQNSTPSVAGNPYPDWTTGPTTIQHLPRQGLLGFIRPVGGINYSGSPTAAKGFLMALSDQDQQNIYEAITRIDAFVKSNPVGATASQVLFENRVEGRNIVDWLRQIRADVYSSNASIMGKIAGLDSEDNTITAADIAAAIPEGLAQAVADEIAKRLAN
jgi:hypothetical protein